MSAFKTDTQIASSPSVCQKPGLWKLPASWTIGKFIYILQKQCDRDDRRGHQQRISFYSEWVCFRSTSNARKNLLFPFMLLGYMGAV